MAEEKKSLNDAARALSWRAQGAWTKSETSSLALSRASMKSASFGWKNESSESRPT